MLAIHDQFTRQIRSRLKTAGMGLGLVRLLQDARRFDEARTTLFSLDNGFHGVATESDKPTRKPRKAHRLQCLSRSQSLVAQNADRELVLLSR